MPHQCVYLTAVRDIHVHLRAVCIQKKSQWGHHLATAVIMQNKLVFSLFSASTELVG